MTFWSILNKCIKRTSGAIEQMPEQTKYLNCFKSVFFLFFFFVTASKNSVLHLSVLDDCFTSEKIRL